MFNSNHKKKHLKNIKRIMQKKQQQALRRKEKYKRRKKRRGGFFYTASRKHYPKPQKKVATVREATWIKTVENERSLVICIFKLYGKTPVGMSCKCGKCESKKG